MNKELKRIAIYRAAEIESKESEQYIIDQLKENLPICSLDNQILASTDAKNLSGCWVTKGVKNVLSGDVDSGTKDIRNALYLHSLSVKAALSYIHPKVVRRNRSEVNGVDCLDVLIALGSAILSCSAINHGELIEVAKKFIEKEKDPEEDVLESLEILRLLVEYLEKSDSYGLEKLDMKKIFLSYINSAIHSFSDEEELGGLSSFFVFYPAHLYSVLDVLGKEALGDAVGVSELIIEKKEVEPPEIVVQFEESLNHYLTITHDDGESWFLK